MWNCPVCNTENEDKFCKNCGFEHSRDYEHYPTFAKIKNAPAAISQRKKAVRKERNVQYNACLCCGRTISSVSCDYCGFIGTHNLDEQHFKLAQDLGENYRQKMVDSLTDFSITVFHYKWNPKKSGLELQRKEERKLADARQFSSQIFWTDPLFGQLPSDSRKNVEIELSYRHKGVKRQIKCSIPTIQTYDFWQLGLLLEPSLTLRLFLGNSTQFTVSQPIALELN